MTPTAEISASSSNPTSRIVLEQISAVSLKKSAQVKRSTPSATIVQDIQTIAGDKDAVTHIYD
jgi:hypothetical protein